MAHNLGTSDDPQWVNVRVNGAQIDLICRATDEEAFISAAKLAGLMIQQSQTVVDPETGESVVELLDEWRWAAGISVMPVGAIQTVAPVYDDAGDLVSAGEVAEGYHVNLRIRPPASLQVDDLGRIKWQRVALMWSRYGADDPVQNASETGRVLYGVSLIDPDTISSPSLTVL